MAEIKTAVVAHCNQNAAIFAAFGNRITPDKIPDKQVLPHACVRQIGNDQRYHLKGEAGRKALIQIDVFDSSLTGADSNAELLRAAFSGFRGQMGAIDAGMVKANITGRWDEEARNFRRLIELEISTND